jgi:acetylornithine/succinyldiaminopimelate/putrescine aminotransferase
MNRSKDYFLQHLGQTNPFPFLIDVKEARGIYIYDVDGKEYMDLIAGLAVNAIGHCHPKVVAAIKKQIDSHMHVMVYGEFVQAAQNQMAQRLISMLPSNLNAVYPVNSGTEANEAAIKLVKRATQRTEIVAFNGAYHGSTNGSLSISSNEKKKQAYQPLLPGIKFIDLNDEEQLNQITSATAGVFLETIQGDAGVRIPDISFIKALRNRCSEVGALLVFDEIQCGLGRTGKIFAFEHYNVVPDILTLGKALGGGMPIGALVSSNELLHHFDHSPMLGHITTFGGHPVICAAANAFLEVLESEIDLLEVERLGKLLEDIIGANGEIIAIRRMGLLFAFDMISEQRVEKVVNRCLEKGLITFWFLSHPASFRLAPPLNITEKEILRAGHLIVEAIEETSR